MRRLREITSVYSETRGLRCECISLNDDPEEQERHSAQVAGARFSGCSGRKLRLIRCVLARLWADRGTPLVVGHLGLAPLARVLSVSVLGGPYVVVLHGIEAWSRATYFDRHGALGAEAIVATTDYTAHIFAEANDVPVRRLRKIALSLPEDGMPASRQSEKVERSDGFEVLSVGRMARSDRGKGFDCLITALAKVRSDGADVRLTLAGEGEEMGRLRDIASRHHVEEYVQFLGRISDLELQRRYSSCDLFALPSAKEGFGIVFIEAMAHGKPCIGGNRGGTPEVIDHGETGFLVDPQDANGLAGAILELYRDPALRQRMGRRAIATVRDRYLFERMREQWFELLDELTRRP